jgi:hypothetical protein
LQGSVIPCGYCAIGKSHLCTPAKFGDNVLDVPADVDRSAAPPQMR